MAAADLKTLIVDKARSLGFDLARVAPAALADRYRLAFDQFLADGRQGDMDWLARTPERRTSPKGLWPEARSILMLAANYGPATDPMTRLGRRDRATISVYAQNRDYHDILKKRLKELGRYIAQTTGAELKVFVDTAPVMEKPLAQAAGLGWQGKHTNLVSRDYGSWLFLAEIFTTLDLEPDAAESDHCGQCRRCLDICPTAAFPAPYTLDARRCLSYLTIEHKGPIPAEFRAPMGNRIYGCDDCLSVCPWNKFAQSAVEPSFLPRAELTAPRLADLAALDDAAFREIFAGSPIKRIGRDRFVRNVLIAIGNSGNAGLATTAEQLLDDPSPLVRGMAVWALGRLTPMHLATLAPARAVELDEDVRAEWDTALG
ncbi:MAG TPA: tRNA epoxyqueuosine(34) reductase QueG [Aliidongia sp.]|uniref:tRNA epoxyqueuosine(34) reductase QueG n=1 Tax=Aliidongia sp. TaxID=1914230 RepID=UPI002DDD54D5|nr:tRNA epoxyqueuosine(34) reductase QueG [Aliidongia sp.]HEV2675206.1 tRNA epoxyqueuosine(34) reductase QueG [Aliidongia sp.]